MRSPERIFSTLNAYQATRALETGIALDLFTAIDRGASSAVEVANACKVSERGARILLDFLTVLQFLTKREGRYSLTDESQFFLSRSSPAYLGSVTAFLNHEMVEGSFDDLTGAVRRGGTGLEGDGTVEPDNPVWVEFAKAMAPMMRPASMRIPALLNLPADRPLKVLDIAAGHGIFGIEVARHFPKAEISALDWPNVLAVAKENAEKAEIGSRYKLIPGNAFDLPFPERYDVVLVTNFLHHFDKPTCVSFMRKVRESLAPGGVAVTLEFVPNEDRISPPAEAAFSIIMLSTTPHGDAYTFSELREIFEAAGFGRNELHALPDAPQHIVMSYQR